MGGGCLPTHVWSCPVVVAEVKLGATVQIKVRSLSLADKIRRGANEAVIKSTKSWEEELKEREKRKTG